jgi:hypothetical protein
MHTPHVSKKTCPGAATHRLNTNGSNALQQPLTCFLPDIATPPGPVTSTTPTLLCAGRNHMHTGKELHLLIATVVKAQFSSGRSAEVFKGSRRFQATQVVSVQFERPALIHGQQSSPASCQSAQTRDVRCRAGSPLARHPFPVSGFLHSEDRGNRLSKPDL